MAFLATGLITFATVLQTVKVKLVNNCGKDVRVRVMHENSAENETYYKDESQTVEVRVGSDIEADGKSIHHVSSSDDGKTINLCH